MNKLDYLRMIENYKKEIEYLSKKIEEKRERRFFATPKERSDNIHALVILYDMKNDCEFGLKRLLKIVGRINDDED